jgi:pyruvyltransferase
MVGLTKTLTRYNFSASIKNALGHGDLIVVKWSRNAKTLNNWGDAVNRFLIEEIARKKVIHVAEIVPGLRGDVYAAIGSILDNNSVRGLHIWGTGMKSPRSRIPAPPKKVHAVRGPLSRARLLELGVRCPPVYGDPALLFPRYFHPRTEKKHRLGIVPHYIDKHDKRLDRLKNEPGTVILDIEAGIFEFPRQLLQCEAIASSSLHGLVLADAYGIPNVHISISDKITGGNFKFRDYAESMRISWRPPLPVTDSTTARRLTDAARYNEIGVDLDLLYESCPFKPQP